MPKINEVLHTPDEAVAKGCCPECGRDMAISDAENEIRLHWPRGLDPNVASEEAIARAKMLRANFAQKAEPKPTAVIEPAPSLAANAAPKGELQS